jgi:hypothetical protein
VIEKGWTRYRHLQERRAVDDPDTLAGLAVAGPEAARVDADIGSCSVVPRAGRS